MKAKRAVKPLATAEKILSNLIRECLASARALRKLGPAKTSVVRPSLNPIRTDSASPTLTDLSVGFRLLEKQERRLLVSALKRVGGNQTKAARILPLVATACAPRCPSTT